MAQAPASLAAPPSPGGMMGGGDPSAGADPTMGGDPSGGDDSSNVVVTICSNGDGSYTVYAGSPPDSGDSTDGSEDDADAMGPAGDAPAPGGGAAGAGGGMGAGMGASQGQPADSVGMALKLALDILKSDQSSAGAPGTEDDQLASGFSASQSPTPATGPAQKY